MEPLVETIGLGLDYRTGGLFRGPGGRGGKFRAVDWVSLKIYPGQTLGLVGESGSGKSTIGRLLLRLIPPSRGRVYFAGRDLETLRPRELRGLRRRMQIIFQDPYSSLNPRFTVGWTLAEPLRVHLGLRGAELKAGVARLLETVGLSAEDARRFPHQFSGGQRQRIAIARAVSVEPGFVVADEPVSALDLSVQGQIIRLLMKLKKNLGMAMLFISHDLSVVRSVAGQVAVMYAGSVVELAEADRLFEAPRHPYTRLLLDSVLRADPGQGPAARAGREPVREQEGKGSGSGCPFEPRCSLGSLRCRQIKPELLECTTGHWAACHCLGNE
ncbi:MAG: oligopeptide/dipeptide ABC transporter ATP-binding protein [Gemmatimonadota bacterium]|nr:oligopeptide/dipeptide ABC transporter ATP-binding protein [Gemmatimonadota bacterium]